MNHPKITRDITADAADYEKALVGICLVEPSQLDILTATVQPDDFVDPINGKIWKILTAMREAREAIDGLTVGQRLKSAGIMGSDSGQITGGEFAGYFADGNKTQVAHAGYYARKVRDKRQRLKLVEIGHALVVDAHDSIKPTADIAQDYKTQIDAIGTAEHAHAMTIGDVATELIDAITENQNAKRSRGVFFGLPAVDAFLGGICPGEVCVIAARPGCGKTTLAMQIAQRAAGNDIGVFFFSLEMSRLELVARVLCGMTELDQAAIRGGRVGQQQMRLIVEKSAELQRLPLWIHDPPRATIGQIGAWLRLHVAAKKPLALIVIDYLQLVKSTVRGEDWQQIGQVCEELKSLAKELQVPIIALAQLGRDADNHEEPRLSHLARAAAIEQTADQVCFIHSRKVGDKQEFSLIVAKNRHGRKGQQPLEFDGFTFREKQVPEFSEFG